MKMRHKRDRVYWGELDVLVDGKTVKTFQTKVSARKFAATLDALRFTPEELEERKARKDFLKRWMER